VGKGTMDTVLNKDRESIQRDVVKSVQAQLDRYKTGILIQTVNIQNVQPPEQVQAAFDDAVKAGQDLDRQKNEGQAYSNQVVPLAAGQASRLLEQAEGYRARVVGTATGDAARFGSVLAEYDKAPQVIRERMYLETMQQMFANTSKVLIDTKGSNNMLYLPLDKIIQQAAQDPSRAAASSAMSTTVPVIPVPTAPAATTPVRPAASGSTNSLTRDRGSR
jgi:membrane protease subunit HflK